MKRTTSAIVALLPAAAPLLLAAVVGCADHSEDFRTPDTLTTPAEANPNPTPPPPTTAAAEPNK